VAPSFRDIGAATMGMIAKLYSSKVNVKYFAATCLNSIVNRRWEGELRHGDEVVIANDPDVTISDGSKGGQVTFEQPQSTAVTLKINKVKQWGFKTEKLDDVQSHIANISGRWSDVAAKQLKIAIETDVFANVYADVDSSNTGASAGKISANIGLGAGTGSAGQAVTKTTVIEKIVDCGQVLTEQNVPETGRWMVIPPWMRSLLLTSDLKDASMTGDTVSPARNGRIGIVDTFELFVSNNLYSLTDGTRTCSYVLFGTNDAITFAGQVDDTDSADDPYSWFTLHKGRFVYGYKVVKPEALGVLICYKSA
jgi:hypothetical protein